MTDLKTCDWKQLGRTLSHNLRICECQRKLRSIVLILMSIRAKCREGEHDSLTPEELFITSLLDRNGSELVTHGTNAEYPILTGDLWDWLDEIWQNPNLEDN
jgi:hypothetical protein